LIIKVRLGGFRGSLEVNTALTADGWIQTTIQAGGFWITDKDLPVFIPWHIVEEVELEA
jgi:hypothetical protein